MESSPSQVIEILVGWLIPPACREEVLGDLRERNPNSGRFFIEAIYTIPHVVSSRIHRTTDAVVALTEAASMYTAFAMAAWWLDRAVLLDQRGFVRLAIPPAIFLVAIVIADAYSNPLRRWALKPLFAPTLGLVLAFVAQLQLNQWALPASVFALGTAMCVLLASTLRMLFPPIADRPQAINTPAFWQKLEFSPLPPGLRDALLPGVILLAVIFFLLRS